MDSKILGIPLAVWFFLVGLGLIIGLPLFFSYKQEMKAIQKTDLDVLSTHIAEVTPTASASATPVPTVTVVPVKRFAPTVKVAPTSLK